MMKIVLNRLAALGRFSGFFVEILYKSLTPPLYGGPTLQATATLIRRCLPPIVLVLVTMGGVMAVQAQNLFTLVRADALLGAVIGVFTFRELAPVIAAVIVGAQGGSFVATELGAMRIKEEFDAMDLMAVDPVRYAVVPRFLSFVLAAPILCMLADVAGLVGGYLAMQLIGDVTSGTFWSSVFSYMQLLDIWNGLIKSFVFAVAIGHLATYYGYHVRGGAAQVGQAANAAVVYSMIAVLASNYVVSSLLFGATAGLSRF